MFSLITILILLIFMLNKEGNILSSIPENETNEYKIKKY